MRRWIRGGECVAAGLRRWGASRTPSPNRFAPARRAAPLLGRTGQDRASCCKKRTLARRPEGGCSLGAPSRSRVYRSPHTRSIHRAMGACLPPSLSRWPCSSGSLPRSDSGEWSGNRGRGFESSAPPCCRSPGSASRHHLCRRRLHVLQGTLEAFGLRDLEESVGHVPARDLADLVVRDRRALHAEGVGQVGLRPPHRGSKSLVDVHALGILCQAPWLSSYVASRRPEVC